MCGTDACCVALGSKLVFRKHFSFAFLLGSLLIFRLVTVAQGFTASPVPSRIVAPVRDDVTERLPGNIYPLAQPEFDTGPIPGTVRADRMMLVLRRSPQQDADLDSFLKSVQDPASPNFHAY